jgi:ribose transport system substrate-binding protein
MNKMIYFFLTIVLVFSLVGCGMDTPAVDEPNGPEADPDAAPVQVSGGDQVAVSLGWGENASAQRFEQGYREAFEEFGWEAVFSNANYDPKLQSEQIDAFIQLNPKALFLTSSDPAGITAAVQRAVAAGIPVFTADSFIAGASTITQIASNNYGMGMYNMEYIAEQIGGEGKVGMIGLPNNETWDLRELGARYVLRDYPDIEVIYWPYDSTGAVTPRQAIENMLTSNPDLKAIWCAWDGAAMEGALAAQSAGKDDIIFTGIDGGERAFEQIQEGSPFKLTMAQSVYWMSYMNVYYANEYLKGNQAPRFVVAPVYAVTKEVLDAVPSNLTPWDYDRPGYPIKLNWSPVR